MSQHSLFRFALFVLFACAPLCLRAAESSTGASPSRQPTLFVIGDSTVRNGQGNGADSQWGWGDPLKDRFDVSRLAVINRGHGGTSSRTFYTNGDWTHVVEQLQPGDFVLLQFGHNDAGKLDDAQRPRGTLKGISEESKDIINPQTKQPETVHTYGWYLRRFVAEARQHGAGVTICSPVPRNRWTGARVDRNGESYGGWAAQVAAAEQVPFIDLNTLIADRYDQLGAAQVEPLFVADKTHTTRAGAELNADCVVAGIRALSHHPLAGFLLTKAVAP